MDDEIVWIGWPEIERGMRRSEATLRKLESEGLLVFRLGGAVCMRPSNWTRFVLDREQIAASKAARTSR